MDNTEQAHTYRLVFTDRRGGSSREVNIEQSLPGPAFSFAREACGNGKVEIFEDEHPLGRIMQASAGFWVIS